MVSVTAFSGKNIAILGLARTGLSTAKALAKGGAKLAVWDEQETARSHALAEGLTLCDLRIADWHQFDGLVLSPGIPVSYPKPHWAVEMAKANKVPILGDIEIFAQTLNPLPEGERAKLVAITGTNGKSTTTALLGHVCRALGLHAAIGGNIGVGVLSLPDLGPGGVYILELSSYQLDITQSLQPDVAILLNISPDHLDRHGGMEGYVKAKQRIFHNQRPSETVIIGIDDPWSQNICTEIMAAGPARVWPISTRLATGRGICVLEGRVYDTTGHETFEVGEITRTRSLLGQHNWQNAAAAYGAALALGLKPEDIIEAIMQFPGLAHRMQEIGQIGSVRFINDSKATNADAARQAMSCFSSFYWIAGGRSKQGGIEALHDLYPQIRKAYLIGEAAEDFSKTLGGKVPHQICGDLQTATLTAFKDAKTNGDPAVILLSPACASFDQFPDFEARGEAFIDIVNSMISNNDKETI